MPLKLKIKNSINLCYTCFEINLVYTKRNLAICVNCNINSQLSFKNYQNQSKKVASFTNTHNFFNFNPDVNLVKYYCCKSITNYTYIGQETGIECCPNCANAFKFLDNFQPKFHIPHKIIYGNQLSLAECEFCEEPFFNLKYYIECPECEINSVLNPPIQNKIKLTSNPIPLLELIDPLPITTDSEHNNTYPSL